MIVNYGFYMNSEIVGSCVSHLLYPNINFTKRTKLTSKLQRSHVRTHLGTCPSNLGLCPSSHYPGWGLVKSTEDIAQMHRLTNLLHEYPANLKFPIFQKLFCGPAVSQQISIPGYATASNHPANDCASEFS